MVTAAWGGSITGIPSACSSGRLVIAFDETAQRHRYAVGVGLALDPERPLGQRLADDLRSTLKAQRLQGLLQPLCNDVVGVGVDDENAGPGHLVFLRDVAS